MFLYDEKFNLSILNRNESLFSKDVEKLEKELNDIVKSSSFLVIGGAGTIGSATIKEIFKRNPKILHVIDISENDLAELVRDIRSSFGYIEGEFKTFVIDAGSDLFEKFLINNTRNSSYDFILNFSALKHVRSEKDPFTLMRMIEVNILNTNKSLNLIKNIERKYKEKKIKKYFCVSTDKATNPVNLMGASKRIMELFLLKHSESISISTARFANVFLSNGSLFYSFLNRINKKQPIVIPENINRYFITIEESGRLCLLSCIFGENREIFFPKIKNEFKLISLYDISIKFLKNLGYEPYFCQTEDEAREKAKNYSNDGKWPCFVSKNDTSGEKSFEEFYTEKDILNLDKFEDIGITYLNYQYNDKKLFYFLKEIEKLRRKSIYDKNEIIKLFNNVLTEFNHIEKNKSLDDKM